MPRWGLALVVVATACYRPAADVDCTLTCNGPDSCPGDLRCGASGLCSRNNNCPGDVPLADAMPPDEPLGTCYGTGFGLLPDLCVRDDDPPTTVLTDVLDTDTVTTCSRIRMQQAGPELCIVSRKESITVDDLRVTGARALVLIAPAITVGVKLDVSDGGAGEFADPSCTPDNTSGQPGSGNGANMPCGGGGAGGSFQGQGGEGGMCLGTTGNGLGGAPIAAQQLLPAFVRGGCRGGGGAITTTSTTPTPGAGGGAVYVAADTITVDGIINASGGGGRGGDSRGGGSGGGSGGMIVLDADTVVLTDTTRLLALGGSGAAGATDATGASGQAPDPDAASVVAIGGLAAGNAGNGGNGSGGLSLVVGEPGKSCQVGAGLGGGGGGGGSGFIRIFGNDIATDQALIAPPL